MKSQIMEGKYTLGLLHDHAARIILVASPCIQSIAISTYSLRMSNTHHS
jgi:hypothetical protein